MDYCNQDYLSALISIILGLSIAFFFKQLCHNGECVVFEENISS